MIVNLSKSNRPDKKFQVIIGNKTIHFGQKGYTDFILSGGDEKRKNRYLARHKSNENWNKSGIDTAGFWSRWLLWNKPTLEKSIKDVEQRFNIKVNLKK